MRAIARAAGNDVVRLGLNPTVLRQDVWDSGAIRKPADLRGKVVDGTSPGGPPNMLLKSLLVQAGLTTADMTFSERLRGGPDVLTALRNHGVDSKNSI